MTPDYYLLDELRCPGLSRLAAGMATVEMSRGDGSVNTFGNASIADVVVVWARDTDDGEVKAIVVEKNLRVPLDDKLAEARSFRDSTRVLTATRGGAAWESLGHAAAYEIALSYATARTQFGRPIASFQLVQAMLAEMLAEITAMQMYCFRMAQLQDEGRWTGPMASLAKLNHARKAGQICLDARDTHPGLPDTATSSLTDMASRKGSHDRTGAVYNLHLARSPSHKGAVAVAFPGLQHVAITVTDLERSTRWYTALFGAQPVLDEDEEGGRFHHTVFALDGGMLFGLHTHQGRESGDPANEERTGLDHISFAVGSTGELEEWASKLDELGIAHGGVKKAHYGSGVSFRDPDNIPLEFFAFPG